ncbi:MAG: hypothetical protein AAFV80_11745, partial [Bacteroidota bacterium]
MEAERFAQLLADHQSLQQLSYQDLERAVMEYPFCQTMRFLLLKKVQMDDHPASQRHLELAATYAPDRAHLYGFLNGLIHIEDDQSGFLKAEDDTNLINQEPNYGTTPSILTNPVENERIIQEEQLDQQAPPQSLEASPEQEEKELEVSNPEEQQEHDESLEREEVYTENIVEVTAPIENNTPSPEKEKDADIPIEQLVEKQHQQQVIENHETEEQLLDLLSAVEESGLESPEEMFMGKVPVLETELGKPEKPPVALEEERVTQPEESPPLIPDDETQTNYS